MKIYLTVALLFVCACASGASSDIRIDVHALFTGSYSEGIDAWRRLEKTDALRYGQSRESVMMLLGAPGFKTSDTFFYKTAGGVAQFEFIDSKMCCRRLVSFPVRWRGTNEEAKQLWHQRQNRPDWYEW